MSKGSKRRPSAVSREVYAKNWDAVFQKPNPETHPARAAFKEWEKVRRGKK